MTITANTSKIRVRFAPSPTGDLHIGGVRTALFTWLFARQHEGDFILRIEDTDQSRLDESSVDTITSALEWYGLNWDEGPTIGGAAGPYYQSERLDQYREYADWLVEHDHAYECFCSSERLAELRKEQQKAKKPTGYDRRCRNLTDDQRAAFHEQGISPVIRLKVPLDGETIGNDLLRGLITFENSRLEDAVLLKSDGFPTYHLAVVVDDHLMDISHATRGEEWIPSFPLHVLLYQAFEWDMPVFVHLPVILRPDGKGKLSKRDGDASALAYRDHGYLPEAVINYLALLGWSYNDRDEIFSMSDLVEKFCLVDVSASPARYDFDKLSWMNQYYINHVLDVDDLTLRCLPLLQAAGLTEDIPERSPEYEHARDAISLVKDKMKFLTEAPELTSFFFAEPDTYDVDLLIPRKTEPDQVMSALNQSRELIAEIGVEDEAALEAGLRELGAELGLKAGQLFMPIRVAVSGRRVSPGLFETLRVVGTKRTLDRIDRAIDKLDASTLEENPA